MKVERAEYRMEDGYPVLRLIIDGKTAYVFDVKRTLLEMGVTPLLSDENGPDWEDILPPITLPAREDIGFPETVLTGITDDPVIVALARDFRDAVTRHDRPFTAGSVDLRRYERI